MSMSARRLSRSTDTQTSIDYDWSDTNLPWAYASTSQFTNNGSSAEQSAWDAATIVNIQTGSSDFYTNLQNTLNAASGRVVVRLGTGVYHMNSFRMAGTSGDPTYSFGFYFAKLQGLLGQGPDKTFVQMDANSMTQTQLDAMSQMTTASFAPLQMGICRIDAQLDSPILLAGLTFRSDDQQSLTEVASDVPAVVPQPAPHQGVVLFNSRYGAYGSFLRFQAAGRAMTSSPPFEMADVSSQYGDTHWHNCEFDGRMSSALDPARPRRCTVWMGNNEAVAEHVDCWMHHSNVSRYAANDQNQETQGSYTLTRTKVDHIADLQNTDPALNNGQSLNGYSDPSCLGWESCNGTITLNNCIVSQDNPNHTRAYPQHISLTSVGSRNPQGGRLIINGGIFRNTGYPTIDGYLCIRAISNTYWVSDGYSTTMNIKNSSGVRKTPFVSTTWPPSSSSLASAGATPGTHYLVRNS